MYNLKENNQQRIYVLEYENDGCDLLVINQLKHRLWISVISTPIFNVMSCHKLSRD